MVRARCLCSAPKLMMLDEPTEGIQPSIVSEIIDILKRLRKSRELTLILVEQKLDFIAALVDRTYVIQRGRITAEIAPQHLSDATIVQEYVGMA